MNNILITGATGFIGAALKQKLLEKGGLKIRILTRKEIKTTCSDVEYIQTDYTDIHKLEKALHGVDAVFHVAGAITAKNFDEFKKANVTATKNIVTACVKTKPKIFVHISSIAAGGPAVSAGKPRNEQMTDAPVSLYGKSKLLGEKELSALTSDTKYVILRPAIVYGQNDSGVYEIINWVKKGIMINPSRDDIYFSFVFIDDMVKAMITAMETPSAYGKTYYICEEKFYSWYGFISEVAKGLNKPMPKMINVKPWQIRVVAKIYGFISRLLGKSPMLTVDKAREFTAGHWIATPHKWMQDTNQTAWTPLCEGIKKSYK
jgi:nucleoside-diphosphate-sugar epimerase